MTTVSAFQLADDELKNLATKFKRRCGTGGSVKDGVIIIQGDHRNTLIAELKNRGFKYSAKILIVHVISNKTAVELTDPLSCINNMAKSR